MGLIKLIQFSDFPSEAGLVYPLPVGLDEPPSPECLASYGSGFFELV